jgi:hypothetical protein
MVENIIVAIIVFGAVALLVVRAVKSYKTGGCSSCCTKGACCNFCEHEECNNAQNVTEERK